MPILSRLTMVDYAIVAILLGAMVLGWVRGFVEVLAGFAVYILTTLVAGRYTGALVGWLNKLFGAEDRLAGVVLRRVRFPPETNVVPAKVVPWAKAAGWVKDLPLPAPARDALAKALIAWAPHAGNETVASFLAHQIAASLLNAVGFGILALVAGWALYVMAGLISKRIKEIPLVGAANSALGAAIYLVETLLTLALVVSLLVPALSVVGWKSLGTAVHQAQLTPYLLAVLDWVKGWFFGGAGYFFGL